MVKKYIFALLVIFNVSVSCFTQDIRLITLNDAAIKQHAELIARELRHNAWHKRLAILAGSCAATYGTYYFFLKESATSSVAAAAVTSAITAGQIMPKDLHYVTLEEFKKILEQKADKTDLNPILEYIREERKKAGTGWSGTFKNWGSTTLNFVVREAAVAVVFSAAVGAFGKYFRSLDNALDSVLYTVFHPGDLQWYIAKHTNIFTLLNDIEYHAHCIEHKRLPKKAGMLDASMQQSFAKDIMLDEDQLTYHKQAFATTWSLCAKEFESILGFMCYKAQKIGKEGAKDLAQRYREITQHVHSMTAEFRLKSEQLLRKNMSIGLVQAVTSLRILFHEERAAFTNCEKI